jgi:hypothetical protein
MTSPTAVPAGTPAIAAAEQAIAHVRRHLFPFRLERWLALGLLSFLDQCPRQNPGSFRLPLSGGDQGGGGDLSQIGAWLGAHVLLVCLLAAAVLAALIVVMAIVMWVHSRAVFAYIDNVATGRAEIARPWQEQGRLADSYFFWSFGLVLVTLVGLMVMGVAAFGLILAIERHPASAAWLVVTLVIGLLVLLVPFLIGVGLASLALRDFVAPLQWQGGLPCGAAVRLFLGLLRAHFWTFVLYLLLKIVFAIVLAMASALACCLTCCCAVLPVIHQTAFQPVYYFERAWSLHLLHHLGFERFATPPVAPAPAPLMGASLEGPALS